MVMASAVFHRFWAVQDAFRGAVIRRMLCHNMAMVGGLLLLPQNLCRGWMLAGSQGRP